MVTYIDSSENSDGVRDGLTREYDTDYKAPTSDSEENDSDEVYWRKRVRPKGTRALREVDSKAKTCHLRKTPKLSVYGTTFMCAS
jgi:hypothetical protein